MGIRHKASACRNKKPELDPLAASLGSHWVRPVIVWAPVAVVCPCGLPALCDPFPSDLRHQRGIFPARTWRSPGVFPVRDLVLGETPQIAVVLRESREVSSSFVQHRPPCSPRSPRSLCSLTTFTAFTAFTHLHCPPLRVVFTTALRLAG